MKRTKLSAIFRWQKNLAGSFNNFSRDNYLSNHFVNIWGLVCYAFLPVIDAGTLGVKQRKNEYSCFIHLHFHEIFLQFFTTVIGINDLWKLVKTQLLKKQYFSFRNNFAQIHGTEKKSKIKDKDFLVDSSISNKDNNKKHT